MAVALPTGWIVPCMSCPLAPPPPSPLLALAPAFKEELALLVTWL